jgi:diguanylate cyclase (GGDEF)-like protein
LRGVCESKSVKYIQKKLGLPLKKTFILFFWICFVPLFALEKVSVQLDWKYQFEFAGFIAAKEKGFYEEVNLDVELREYHPNIDTVNDVLNGISTYGIYHSSIFIEDKKIKPIVILATYLQKSPLIFIAQKGITQPTQMIHKTIMGTKNELKYSALGLMLEYYHINKTNATIVEHTFDLNDFIQKRVDVMSAFRSNQLFELKQQNIEYEIIEPFDFGFNMSAGNLFTSKEEAINHTKRTQAFIQASNKGWKYAIEHSEEIIDILIEKYGVKKSKASLLFEANEVKKLMMLDFFRIGEINDELTKLMFRQLKKVGFIDESEHLHNFVFDSMVKNINIDFLLTEDEKEYLEKKKRILMCIDPQWYPFEVIQNKKHIGIAADVMKNFEEKLGIPIEYVPVKSWQESIELAKKRECDIFSLASRTPSRLEYMNFTSPYLTLPIVIATTNDSLYFSVATRNDEPLLNEIFEKLVQSLDEQSMQMIFNRWVSTIEEVTSYNKDFIITLFVIFIAIIAVFLYRQYLLQRYNKALLKLSITDNLTGLYNRLKTDEKLEEEQKKVLRYESYCCTILLLDVDHFKRINDHFGHQIGDKVLQEIATVLKNSVRDTDIVGRWGGEEFLIILPNTNKEEGFKVGMKLKDNIASHHFYQINQVNQVTISLGGFELQKNISVNEAMSQVDKALYESKNKGRNQVTMA